MPYIFREEAVVQVAHDLVIRFLFSCWPSFGGTPATPLPDAWNQRDAWHIGNIHSDGNPAKIDKPDRLRVYGPYRWAPPQPYATGQLRECEQMSEPILASYQTMRINSALELA